MSSVPRVGRAQIALAGLVALLALLLAAPAAQAQTVQGSGYSSIPLLDNTWIFAKLSASGDPQCVPTGSACLSAADNATLWNGAGSVTSTQLNSPIVCGSALKTSSGTTGYEADHWCWQAAALLGSSIIKNDNWCADPAVGTTDLRNRWVYHPARKTYIDCYGLLHPTIVNAVSGGTNVTFTDIPQSIPLRKAMTVDGLGAGFEIDQAMFQIGYADFTFSFWMLPDASVTDKQILFSDRIYSTGSGENFTFALIHPAEERLSLEIFSGSVSEYQVMEVRNLAGYHYVQNLFNATWKHVVFVRHASNLSMYLDGAYVASDVRASSSVALLGGIANVRMGARGPANIYDRSPWTPYKGKLDDVRLYTRVLSDAEIATMFATARNPWTVNMKLLQLANGSYIYVELSSDGVDAQCWGSNGVCLIGASESDLLAAASVTTASLSDRVRCGSELQNITGDTGYTTGLAHWCAQAIVFLKGTTTTGSTTTITTQTTQTSTTTSQSTTSVTTETTTQTTVTTSATESRTLTSTSLSTTTTPAKTTTTMVSSLGGYSSMQLLDGTWIFVKLDANGNPQCVPSGSTCLFAADNATLWSGAGSVTSTQLNSPIVCGSALETSSGTTGYEAGHWCWEAAALLGSSVVKNDNWCADPVLGTTDLRNRWVYHPARKSYIDCYGLLHPTIVNAVSGGTNVTFTDIPQSIPLRKAMTVDGLGAGFEIDQAMFQIGYADFTFSFWMLPDASVTDKQLLFSDRVYATGSGENFTFALIHPAEERLSLEIMSGSTSEYQVMEVRNLAGYHYVANLFNSTWKHVAFVRHASNLSMYVDGVYVASDFRASTSVALLGGIANVRMGARAPPNIYDRSPWTPYKGKLDDVRLYTRVLNDAEIATMFATARNPWTVNMKLLQLSNGSYIYVELSADGVDAQCWGSNGVCLIGASESDLLSAASVTTMSLSDRVRCGSELQNITGDTGYTTGLTHWCAQASVFLKGTTTTETTTSITVSTTQTSATLTVSLTTTALETTTQGQTSTTQGETSTTQGQTSTALVGQTSTALVTTTAGSPPAATTTRAATTTFASNPGAVACSNAPSVCSSCSVTQLYQIGTLAAAQTALGSTEYAFFTASLAGSSSALLGPLSSGFPAMFVGVAYSGSAVSKMCFQASNTAGGALWSVLGSMALISHVQTGDSSLQSKLQTAFGLTITGTACAAGTAGCTTSAVITSKIASGSNVVALAGGVLDLTAPVFETTHVKGASTLNFQITGNISISTGCTDAICSSFKSYLGASPVKAVGTGIPGNFSFTAPLANIQLSNDFTLTKANFMYKPSTEEMGIVGEIKIAADDTLTLTAEIAALFDGSKVELEGTMVGIWSSVFNQPRLSVGNLVATLPLNPTQRASAPFPEFIVGGDLAVGPQPCFAAPPPRTFSCARWTTAEKVLLADPRQDAANGGIGSTERLLCSKDRSRSYFYDQTKAPCDCRCCQLLPSTPKTDCLNGVGQIGIYPSNQANNFFAVPMEDIALSDITKALVDGPVALPAALASTSFLGTVLFSSSASQRTILGGLSIPKGTAFSGPIAILGTKGTGVVSMDPTKGFVVDAAPGPLSIADILVLSKNGSTPNLGPMIRIDARGTKANAPAITGSGFMTLLSSGGKAPATMTISGSGLLTVSANIPLWGFGSAVNVSSRLGGKWDDMPVGVSIKFSRADFTVKFANLVVAQLKSYAKRRSDQLAFAQSAVKTRAAQVKSALVKTCDPKTCEAPVTKIDCTQWVRRPLCPATRSCANYDVACWAYNAFATACYANATNLASVCTDWDTVATKQTTASCHAKCSVSVANLKYATGALLEARDIVKCLQVHFAWAQKLAEHVGKFATPFSLDSIDAGLDLRMEGTNAGQGNVPTEMSGKLFGQPYETDFSMDFKNLPLSAHKFFGARIIPAAMSSFGAGASTSTVARGRREKLKAAAIRGNGAFLWGR